MRRPEETKPSSHRTLLTKRRVWRRKPASVLTFREIDSGLLEREKTSPENRVPKLSPKKGRCLGQNVRKLKA